MRKEFALAIPGQNINLLNTLGQKTESKRELLDSAYAVIIYRSSPKDKADAVNLVKKFYCGRKRVLAIGDGANDVNMIQESHVGIGILGVESGQAAAYADFSVAEFKDLRRLMFWHGRKLGG